jgi:WD40 repeat protein
VATLRRAGTLELRGRLGWWGWSGSRLAVLVRDRSEAAEQSETLDPGSLCVWDVATGARPLDLRARKRDTGERLAWSPDGKRVALGTSGGRVTIRSGPDFSVVRSLTAHEAPHWLAGVRCLAWSPDGKMLATAALEGSAKIWDTDTGAEVARFPFPRAQNFSSNENFGAMLAWHPGGQRLAIADQGGVVRVWDIRTRKEVLTLHGHQGIVALAWSPDGSRLVGAAAHGNQQVTRLWDSETGEAVMTLPGVRGPARWSADGCWLEGSADGLVRLTAVGRAKNRGRD